MIQLSAIIAMEKIPSNKNYAQNCDVEIIFCIETEKRQFVNRWFKKKTSLKCVVKFTSALNRI